jgi:hypothetical protein
MWASLCLFFRYSFRTGSRLHTVKNMPSGLKRYYGTIVLIAALHGVISNTTP